VPPGRPARPTSIGSNVARRGEEQAFDHTAPRSIAATVNSSYQLKCGVLVRQRPLAIDLIVCTATLLLAELNAPRMDQ
jgi:hypothetical protein